MISDTHGVSVVHQRSLQRGHVGLAAFGGLVDLCFNDAFNIGLTEVFLMKPPAEHYMHKS